MQKNNIIVRTFTLITAVLSFIILARLRQRQIFSAQPVDRPSHKTPLHDQQRILLESAVFELPNLPGLSSLDDLKQIRGIGRKSEYALNQAGITSFRQLGELSQEQIETILSNAGVKVFNCENWQTQAKQLTA